jgi:hypothetical protein
MIERVFTYTWSDAKRLTVLHALGFMYAKLATTPKVVTETVEGLIGELSSTPGADCPAPCALHNPASGTEAARAVLAPPMVDPTRATDYFQRDKKGNVLMAAPDGAELSRVKIVSAQKFSKAGKAPYLKVIFAAGVTIDGKTRPAGQANCFDQDLWPPIKNREGQVAALWIQESGNYLNVVGIRA